MPDDTDRRVQELLAELKPRLQQLMQSGGNWKIVINAGNGEIKIESTEYRRLTGRPAK